MSRQDLLIFIYFYRYYLYNERYGGKMMDEYRDNQVKKLMMKRRKKKRIKVIRLFFVLGIIGFVFFILLSDIMKIKTIMS